MKKNSFTLFARGAKALCLGTSLLLGNAASMSAQTPVLLKEINPGFGNANDGSNGFMGFTKFADDRIFFFADNGNTGLEPFVSDGTAAGTTLIKDIASGSDGCQGFEGDAVLNPSDKKIYFLAKSENNPNYNDLYATDGTAAGTKRVNSDNFSESISNLTAVGGKIAFRVGETQYYVSDGTATGTYEVLSSTKLTAPVLFKNVLYFGGQEGDNPILYKLDLSKNKLAEKVTAFVGTTKHRMSRPQIAHNDALLFSTGVEFGFASNNVYYYSPTSNTVTKVLNDVAGGFTKNVIAFKGKTYFIASTKFYETNGTAAGTKLLNTLEDDYALLLGKTDDYIFIQSRTNAAGVDLFTYNPTKGLVSIDINAGDKDAVPFHFVGLGNKAYFQAKTEAAGEELWVSDGTKAGTKLVTDFYAGATGSSPFGLKLVRLKGKDQIYYWATTASGGFEPYRIDVLYASPVQDKATASTLVFSLSPNPSREQVRLSLAQNTSFKAQQWTISDHTGRQIQQGKMESNEPISISTSALQVGIYWLSVYDAQGEKSTQALLVQ
jgi:ELWxxDGT repeat protein